MAHKEQRRKKPLPLLLAALGFVLGAVFSAVGLLADGKGARR